MPCNTPLTSNQLVLMHPVLTMSTVVQRNGRYMMVIFIEVECEQDVFAR